MASKQIKVGNVLIGGGAPITVQSMTNTKTENVEETSAQIARLEAAGCDIVRVAVPNMDAAKAIAKLKERTSLPIVADIHFDYKLAIEAANAGADKIRINPGNIGSEDRVKAVVDECRKFSLPIRIGVNGGSLEKEIKAKYGGVTPEAMLESAMGHVSLLNKFDFDDVCISVKSSDVMLTIKAYRLMAERTNFPLHLGVTEAGTEYSGIIKSAAGIGTLLAEGIGDTIRVSLTAPPEREVTAGISLLKALDIRKEGVRLVSCPSCGRCNINLIEIAQDVERRLSGCKKNITVAVMGCVVNGPGEASDADFGIAGGLECGLLFRKGEILGKVPMANLADELMKLIEESND